MVETESGAACSSAAGPPPALNAAAGAPADLFIGSPAAGDGAASSDHALPQILGEALASATRSRVEAVPLLLDHLLQGLGARLVVFFRKEARRRRRLIGRRNPGVPVGRPDKLLSASHLRQVLRSAQDEWIPDALEPTRAGFPLRLAPGIAGAVIVQWRHAPGWLASPSSSLQAKSLAQPLGLAALLDGLEEERRALRDEIDARSRRDALAAPPACPPAVRAILEYPLEGEPCYESARRLHSQFPEIVGESPSIRAVVRAIVTAAASDIPILIEGESGTGKELVARAIHRASRRRAAPFICENCGAVPEGLVESEFFGHERGAFTGADAGRPGLFERAHGGTVFLDEIGEMDLSLQKKILRVLQEKEIRRIGGQETLAVDFRVVSATNRVLEDLVAAKRFREDLYYRLNVTTIYVPALREHSRDIVLLVEHFSRVFAATTAKDPLTFSDAAMEALAAYRWPGNVRELRNEIWRLAASDARKVSPEDLSRRILRGGESQFQLPDGGGARRLEEIEREFVGGALLEALRRSHGNRTEAARQLGISRASLYRRLERYGLAAASRSVS